MRTYKFLSIATTCSMLLLGAAQSASGQLSNPVPAAIQPGISVGIELIATLPDTTADVNDGRNTDTRINFFRQTTDGRRFVNDQRGVIYELDSDGNDTVYINTRNILTNDIYTGSLASGLTSFTFHPDFANNGLFYTIQTETPNGSPTPDTIPATFDLSDVTFHAVVTEWTATTPSAATFSGTRREILRVGSTAGNAIHPLGDCSFNPTAVVGDADYGILYIAGGDWAISTLDEFDALQRLDTLAGTMLRIDPTSPSVSGGIAGLGDYTIPADNPFANDGDPDTFGEIYAYGFRNLHRVSWDAAGIMYGTCIGQNNLEEVNIIHAGGNYGWGEREGGFLNGQAVPGGEKSEVYTATSDPAFQDPVAQYDHDEGSAIAGGFAYQGTLVPELQGKFVFGDIVDGRLFYTDLAEMIAADDGDVTTVALVHELLLEVNGSTQTMQQITNAGRVDMRFGIDNDGEIIVLAKADGSVRRFVTLEPVDPGPSEWTLVDDFEGHTVGNAVAGVVGPGATWTGTTDPLFLKHTAEVDPDDASNQAMKLLGRPRLGGEPDALVRAELGASDFIASGATGTLFYRFRTPVGADGTQDHVVGLTSNNAITNFNFKSGLRNTVPTFVPPAPSVGAVNNMDARNGSPYESVASLADNAWYKLWMVSTNDPTAGTWDLYIQSDTDTNFSTQTLLGANISYRNSQSNADPIINVYFRAANNDNGVEGNDLYFDDVYINSSAADLTDPTATSFLLGDVDLSGAVNFLDISPFIDRVATGTFQAEADCDENGSVNFLDISAFITILTGQ